MFNSLYIWAVQIVSSPWRMRLLLTTIMLVVVLIAVALPGAPVGAGPMSGGPD